MANRELAGILCLAAAVRWPHLIGRPLWQDEALTHYVAHQDSVGNIVRAVRDSDLHPPLHALLLSPLTQGPPWFIRLPSLIAGIAAVWMAYRLGRALGGHATARAAGCLAALLPAWVAYSHEARPYSVGLFLILALYVHIAEDRECPKSHVVTAVLCGMWQYSVAGMALASLCVACVRRPDRWALPTVACGLSASLTAALMLPVQWERTQDLATRMDPGMGWEVLAFGFPSLAGFTFLGTAGAVSLVLGGAVMIGVVALRRTTPHDASLIWAPLGVFVFLAVVGWHPFGAARPCLPLTLPMLLLGLGAYVHLPRSAQVGVPLILLLVVGWRSPGVPVEDVPRIVRHLHGARLPVSAHASSAHALALYAPKLKLESVIPWGCSFKDLPQGEGWLIVSGQPACLEGLSPEGRPWVPEVKKGGVRLFKTPLPVSPATPQRPQGTLRQHPEAP